MYVLQLIFDSCQPNSESLLTESGVLSVLCTKEKMCLLVDSKEMHNK